MTKKLLLKCEIFKLNLMSFSINTGFEVREVIDRFVDIGGIFDHHCLNILFITVKKFTDFTKPYFHEKLTFIKLTY
jgi:hypothetical protein